MKSHPNQTLLRISALETTVTKMGGDLNSLASGLAKALQGVDDNFSAFRERVDAIVELIGIDKIAPIIERYRIEAAAKELAKAIEAVTKAVETGEFVPTTVVSNKSFIIGRHLDKDGIVIGAGREQCFYQALADEYKKQLLGARVGAKIFVGEATFELAEIYDAPALVDHSEILVPTVIAPEDTQLLQ